MNATGIIHFAKQTVAGSMPCGPGLFDLKINTFLPSDLVFFRITTFGRGAVIEAGKEMLGWCQDHFAGTKARHILDSENLFLIEEKLRAHGKKLCGEHLRYLYLDSAKPVPRPEGFRYALYLGEEVKALHAHKGYGNALNYSNDVIALAAWDGGTLAALAAADDGLAPLWQIGIDTLPAYRQRGLATYLVKALSDAIRAQGHHPFYTTWGANLASTRVALGAGYLPVWLQYFAESK